MLDLFCPDDIALIGVAHLGTRMPGLRRAIEMVRGVPHALQQWENCEANVEVPREVMVACYDGSQSRPAKHQPHRDNAPVVGTPGENAREITVLCYLNKDWKTEWGGQLRCHPHADITDQVWRSALSCFVLQLKAAYAAVLHWSDWP